MGSSEAYGIARSRIEEMDVASAPLNTPGLAAGFHAARFEANPFHCMWIPLCGLISSNLRRPSLAPMPDCR